jgi:hypothetical protein
MQTMTPFGKPLVFYLKYMAEMDRRYGEPELSGGEEPDLTGLDDAQHVREMARSVGAAACQAAADFLELCGTAIEKHFTGLGIVTPSNTAKRATVVRNWDWYTCVHMSGVRFYCGAFVCDPSDVRVSVDKDVCGLVVPYLSARGCPAAALWKSLGDWPYPGAGVGLVENKRMVALACIPIKAQLAESFDVDRDPLISEVTKTIAHIGAEQIKAIASCGAGVKEPDEA